MLNKNDGKITSYRSTSVKKQDVDTFSKSNFDQLQWQREVIKEELVEDLQRKGNIRWVI